MRGDAVGRKSTFENGGPLNEEGRTDAAFIHLALHAPHSLYVSPAVGAVIGQEEYQRVIRDSHIVEFLEEFTDVLIDIGDHGKDTRPVVFIAFLGQFGAVGR